MRLSEEITGLIISLLDEGGGIAEINRNSFAQRLGCVPSQINYVLDSRFTSEKGYIIESRRGGGGYIRIMRISQMPDNTLMHAINSIGSDIDLRSAQVILSNLVHSDALDEHLARILVAAVSDNSLTALDKDSRYRVRANILKNMLLAVIGKGGFL